MPVQGLPRTLPLPVRAGVSPSHLWLPAGAWPDLLAFLVQRFPHVPRAVWTARMESGEMVDAQGSRLTPSSPYRAGMCIFYYREIGQEPRIPYTESILYRDDQLLVADKPHFLPVIPTGRFVQESLLVRLRRTTGLEHLAPIHRIDRETAGVVVFCHQRDSRDAYQALFRRKEVEKVYEAIAPLHADLHPPLSYRSRMVDGEPFFRMQEIAGEPNSETLIDILKRHGQLGLYRLRPRTGKKHQLRVHLAALGIPILHDAFYPEVRPCKGDDISQPLQLLAKSVAFRDPLTGEERFFESRMQLAWPGDSANPAASSVFDARSQV